MAPVDALPRLRELSALRAALRERGAGPLHEQHLLRCWTQQRPLTRRGAAPDHFLPSRVLADWPGLAARDRYEGRDLRTTTDLRAVFRSVLGDHLGVSTAALDRQVFPGTTSALRLDLLRG